MCVAVERARFNTRLDGPGVSSNWRVKQLPGMRSSLSLCLSVCLSVCLKRDFFRPLFVLALYRRVSRVKRNLVESGRTECVDTAGFGEYFDKSGLIKRT